MRGVRDGGKVVGLMIIDSGKAGVMWCEKQKMGRTGSSDQNTEFHN